MCGDDTELSIEDLTRKFLCHMCSDIVKKGLN